MTLLILGYHQVSETFDPRLHFRTTWTSMERFRAGMELLAKNHEVVSIWDGLETLARGESRGLQVALSFDDGYASITDAAALLEQLELPATFFVNSAYVGTGEAHWYAVFKALKAHPERQVSQELEEAFGRLRRTMDPVFYRKTCAALEERAPEIDWFDQMFVGWEFLRSLDGSLFQVALHGHEHQRFSMMPERWQRDALDRNIEALEGLPGYRPLFAVPFGRPLDWTAECHRLCRARSLTMLMADGGVNDDRREIVYRIPADNLDLEELLKKHILAAG